MEAKLNAQQESNYEPFEYNMSWESGRIISIVPEANIKEAAKLMRDEQVGSVLVMETEDDGGTLLGVVTDRDLALCFANEEDLEDLRVADIMSESVITGSADDSIFKLIGLMKNAGVTRLPLVNKEDEVVGVVTARNLLEILTKSFFDLTQIGEQQRQNEQAHH
jgi:predicted transcriptional regulator